MRERVDVSLPRAARRFSGAAPRLLRRLPTLAAAALVVLVLLTLLLPVAALAGSATFSAQSPAPGSTITALRPSLSVQAADAAGIRTDSASYLLLDGKTLRARFTLISGSSLVRLSFTPSANLAVGSHTVTAGV